MLGWIWDPIILTSIRWVQEISFTLLMVILFIYFLIVGIFIIIFWITWSYNKLDIQFCDSEAKLAGKTAVITGATSGM